MVGANALVAINNINRRSPVEVVQFASIMAIIIIAGALLWLAFKK